MTQIPGRGVALDRLNASADLYQEIQELLDDAIAAEREACAKIAEKLAGADVVYPEGIRMIAAAIRARGMT